MELFIIIGLILLTGFLVLCEIALISAKRAKLESEKAKGNRNAAMALDLLKEPEQFLSAMQVGITLCSVVEGAYGGVALAGYLKPFVEQISWLAPYVEQVSVAIVISLITYFSLVVGELAPKSVAIQYAEPIAIATAPAMKFIATLTYPIASLLSISTKFLLKILFIKPNKEQSISEDELKLMIRMANQQGVLEHKESEFIQNILRFADRDAYNIMTHRNDVEWLDVNAPAEENDKIIRESGYTKFLVCDDTIENILGVIRLRDYIDNHEKPDFDLKNIVSQPLFIPESMNALKILESFRNARNYFAVVVDEYGSTQGIITLHDLTENIFGTLPDLDDTEEPSVVTREDGSWLVDGTIPIDELREVVNLPDFDFEDADYTTLAGYILYKLSEIPKSGDHFNAGIYRFEVIDMDKSKIDKVLISKTGNSDSEED